jgi:hypothetical protein
MIAKAAHAKIANVRPVFEDDTRCGVASRARMARPAQSVFASSRTFVFFA